jgi:hypothetical protein
MRGGKKAKREHPEDDLQISLVSLLQDVLRRGVVMAHVPNQGLRLVRYLKKLLRMGMKEGIADLLFFHEGRTFFLELKSSTGSLNENQRKFRAEIEAAGFEYRIAKTLDAAIEIVKEWGLINPRFQIPTTEKTSVSRSVSGRRAANGKRSVAPGGGGSPADLWAIQDGERAPSPTTRGSSPREAEDRPD